MAIKSTPKITPSKNSKPATPVAAPAAKPAAPVAAKPAAQPVKTRAPYQPSKDEIAARAYQIYEREGGNEHDNWLRAERELIARGSR
jgi:hypothetical protein